MKRITSLIALTLALTPLMAAAKAVPEVHLTASGRVQRSASAKAWRTVLGQFTVNTRTPAHVQSLFIAIEGQNRRGLPPEGERIASVLHTVELFDPVSGRSMNGALAEASGDGLKQTAVYRFDDFSLSKGDEWQLRVRLKGNKRIDWLRSTVCGNMAEGKAPCVSADGGSQYQPWVTDVSTGADAAITPALLQGTPVVLRGLGR